MVLGMSLLTFTVVHTAISLVAIVTGIIVAVGMLSAKRLPIWTAVFLATTILTSVTGFLFPFDGLKPSHIFGGISVVLLALAVLGLYVYDLAGPWRRTYVIASVAALYLNVFVLVVQSFLKVPFLTPLAPTGTEPPFAVAQVVVLALFIWLGFKAVRGFHPGAGRPTLGLA
jgi:hypothetical protein